MLEATLLSQKELNILGRMIRNFLKRIRFDYQIHAKYFFSKSKWENNELPQKFLM